MTSNATEPLKDEKNGAEEEEFEIPFQAQAEELKKVARNSVRNLRTALEERAPPHIVETAARIENHPQVQNLINTPVPFALFLVSLAVKTLVAMVFSPSLVVQFTLDVVLITMHVWLNGAQKGKRRIKFSKDALFEFTPHVRKPSVVAAAPATSDKRFPAGFSMKPIFTTPTPKVDMMCYNDTPAQGFKVRNTGYAKTKSKLPSQDSLYTLLRLDLIRNKQEQIGNHKNIDLPTNTNKHSNTPLLPNLLILNAQIPDKAPSMLGGKNKDDLGFSLIFYFELKPWAVAEQDTSAAVRLFKRYVGEHASNPDIRRRFKAMGIVDNSKELGSLAGLVDAYNGKPAIINKTAKIYQSSVPGEWFEIDISIFDFPYLSLKGLASVKDMVAGLGLRAGFVLQGENDDELPEVLLGGAEFCIDFALAKALD